METRPRLWRGWNGEDWEWMFEIKQATLEGRRGFLRWLGNSLIRLPPPFKVRLWVKSKQIISHKPSRCVFHIPPSSHSLLLRLSFSFSLSSRIVTIVPSCYLLTEASFSRPNKSGGVKGTCVNRLANDRCPSEAEGWTMREEHPGVSSSPFAPLFLFMWGPTPSLTSSLPFLFSKRCTIMSASLFIQSLKRQEDAVTRQVMYKQVPFAKKCLVRSV